MWVFDIQAKEISNQNDRFVFPQNLERRDSRFLVTHLEAEAYFEVSFRSSLHRLWDSTIIDCGDIAIDKKLDAAALEVTVNRASLRAIIPHSQSTVLRDI